MKRIYPLLFFALLCSAAKSTHIRGGEIIYKRIAPFISGTGSATVEVYTYSITILKYFDSGTNIGDRCVDTVYFGDGSSAVAARINGSVTGCCPGQVPCGELIISLPGYNVKKNVYSVTHTYPGPGNYVIHSVDANRNQGIINIPNSVNDPFYLESLLVIGASFVNNSSVVSSNIPAQRANNTSCFYHTPGSTDADGDSLSYDLTASRSFGGQVIPGFTFPTGGSSGYFFINQISGLLHWCVPESKGEFNFGIMVKEWRKNSNGAYNLIGYVIREMQVLVVDGVVGLREAGDLQTEISFSPNPFSNELKVVAADQEIEKVEVFSTEGRLLFTQTFRGAKTVILNTEFLPGGLYLVGVHSATGTVLKKVVKGQ